MRYINEYILEKLKLDKNIKLSNSYKFIVYYKKTSREEYKDYVVIDDLSEIEKLRQKELHNSWYRIFQCPEDLISKFVEKWENFSPFGDDEDDFWSWAEKNDIKELSAKDVNDYFSRKIML